MGKYFKEFCDKQRKDKKGHVPYILDMTEAAQDKAVIAYFKDSDQNAIAAHYQLMTKKGKDETYSLVEYVITDMIDKYNLGIDLAREIKIDPSASELDAFYPDRCPLHEVEREHGYGPLHKPLNVNQACEDAGHNPGDFF